MQALILIVVTGLAAGLTSANPRQLHHIPKTVGRAVSNVRNFSGTVWERNKECAAGQADDCTKIREEARALARDMVIHGRAGKTTQLEEYFGTVVAPLPFHLEDLEESLAKTYKGRRSQLAGPGAKAVEILNSALYESTHWKQVETAIFAAAKKIEKVKIQNAYELPTFKYDSDNERERMHAVADYGVTLLKFLNQWSSQSELFALPAKESQRRSGQN